MLTANSCSIFLDESFGFDKWFYIPRRIKNRSQRLYCFPHAGGSANFFRAWVDQLDDDIELCAINLPGRGVRGKEPLNIDITSMSYDIAEAIQQIGYHSFSFFGHSMGATLAYEVMCRLRENGFSLPQHLFVSARQAPQVQSEYRAPVADMSNTQFREKIIALNGVPKDLERAPELLEFYLPVLKADFQAIDNWKYTDRPPMNVPITALWGGFDPTTSKNDILKWREQCTAEFYFYSFQGDHFYLQQYQEKVVNIINQSISF